MPGARTDRINVAIVGVGGRGQRPHQGLCKAGGRAHLCIVRCRSGQPGARDGAGKGPDRPGSENIRQHARCFRGQDGGRCSIATAQPLARACCGLGLPGGQGRLCAKNRPVTTLSKGGRWWRRRASTTALSRSGRRDAASRTRSESRTDAARWRHREGLYGRGLASNGKIHWSHSG